MKKVVLVVSNPVWIGHRRFDRIEFAAPLLTSMLKEEFDFSIIDTNAQNLSRENFCKELESLNPHVVLIGAWFTEHRGLYRSVSELTRQACPDAKIVYGGSAATILPDLMLDDPNLDYLFMGHAEERIVPFLKLLLSGNVSECRKLDGIGYVDANGEKIINKVTSFICNLKDMIKPDFSLIDMGMYLRRLGSDDKDGQLKASGVNSGRKSAVIVTTYGCPHNCLFCSSRTIRGRGIAYRPVADVLEEIDYYVLQHGVECVMFGDDAMLTKKSHINAILNGIIERGYNLELEFMNTAAWDIDDDLLELMKKAGCSQITISCESGSPRVLKEIIRKPLNLNDVPRVVKKCRELGIFCSSSFVIGLPGETWEEIRQTFKFAEEQDFDMAHFNIAMPLPMTDLYKICVEQNLLSKEFDFSNPLSLRVGSITTDEFSPLELMVLRAYEYDRINFSTPEKEMRVAKMFNITLDKLRDSRRRGRRWLGFVNSVRGNYDDAAAQKILVDILKKATESV